MNRTERINFYLSVLKVLKPEPMKVAAIATELNQPIPQVQKAIKHLGKANLLTKGWGTASNIPAPEHTVQTLSKALGYNISTSGTQAIQCSICDEVKPRKTIVEDKVKTFVDPTTDNLWQKDVCPDCVAISDQLDDPVVEMTTRKCRGCDEFLPATRYFNCTECQPELPNVAEDFMFEDVEDWELDESMYEDFESEESFAAFTKESSDQKKREDIILQKNQWKKVN